MNDSHFKLNPILTNNHAYWCPPVGKSLWRKRAKDGPLVGIKAKTVYPKRPDSWTDDWMPDTVLALIQGKSVGFLWLKSHAPGSHKIGRPSHGQGVPRDRRVAVDRVRLHIPADEPGGAGRGGQQ